jgi:mono/diheme cytochrome c family protein
MMRALARKGTFVREEGISSRLKRLVRGLAVLLTLNITAAYAKEAKSPGKATFEENCTFCHGDDGTGKTPPGMALGAHDLTSSEVKKKTDSELMETIIHGRNKMPPFGDKLDTNQVYDLILYIRTLGKK